MAVSNEQTYLGTELKYLIEITASGFSMADDDFEVEIIRGSKVLHFDKTDMETDEQGNWYVCFDTKDLKTGKISARITAHVPDNDYPDGIRDEVQRIDLITVKA